MKTENDCRCDKRINQLEVHDASCKTVGHFEVDENEQINDAIAAAIQWTGGWLARPYFCGDLNAMHEAEMCIPEDKQALYDSHLSAIVVRETGEMPNLHFRCIHASAKQRAKAFLRTVGKWEEAQ